MLTWKIRITVLWISAAVLQSGAVFLLMLEPGAVRGMLAGELAGADLHSASVQVNAVLFLVGPLVFAYLTLVLKDTANRWMNGVLAAGAALNGISELSRSAGGAPVGTVLLGVVQILVVLLIVWHAWKWPRPTGPISPRRMTVATHRGP